MLSITKLVYLMFIFFLVLIYLVLSISYFQQEILNISNKYHVPDTVGIGK